ncbi:MAG: glycosyltransferase family 2 protein [Bacteroidales bacterium]|nr:glycosyltransferase family 2 protein [Bacteroidales bacterium]
MRRVLVIIVTYNGMRWLDRCLSSVCAAGKAVQNLSVDVFVVDNDSTDGSADWIQGHFPGVKLVRSAENLGFTRANNLGFERAVSHHYDYVYLLNQDAWLAPGALEMLVASAEEHPEYAVLSPLQMTDGYKELDKQFAKRLPGKPAMTSPSCPAPAGHLPVEVPFIMAAHWLVPVGALRKIGPFSELFPYYGQDDDWCHRAHYHGFKIGVVPQARAVHDRAQRQESKERVIDRNYRVGSLVRLCDINRPLWERFLFVCLFTLVKAVKYRSLLPFRHFRSICRQLPAVRGHRAASR